MPFLISILAGFALAHQKIVVAIIGVTEFKSIIESLNEIGRFSIYRPDKWDW